jgi:AcrR family transcriptional regulator
MARHDKRRQIMQATERLFTTRRFHEITTDDIARTASVGKGTIYRYFADKEDLFFQTATSGFDALCDLVRQKAPDGASFHRQLTETCGRIRAFFEHRRQMFRMMQTEDGRILLGRGTLRQRWMAHRRDLTAAVAEVLRKGIAEGVLRTDVPAEVLATFLLGMLRTQARDLADVPAALTHYGLVVDLFCRGAGRSRNKTPRPRRAAAGRRAGVRSAS